MTDRIEPVRNRRLGIRGAQDMPVDRIWALPPAQRAGDPERETPDEDDRREGSPRRPARRPAPVVDGHVDVRA